MINLRCTFSAMLVQVEETRTRCGAPDDVLSTIDHPFMCITDLDDGMSVTNDIENVLAVLSTQGRLTPGMRVVYRDSEGIWDEVLIDHRCEFVTFRALRERTRDAAIAKVVKLTDGRLN